MLKEYSPKNAAELMDSVLDIYKKSFGKQISYAAIVYAIGVCITVVFSSVFSFVFIWLAIIGEAGTTPLGNTSTVTVGAIIIIVWVAMSLWAALSSSGHILLSKQVFYGYKLKINMREVFGTVFRIFTAIIAQTIAFIPLTIIIMGVVFALAFSSHDAVHILDRSALIVIVIVPVIILCIVAVLVYSNIFALSIAVSVFERRYFFGALKRSWELVKPEFWRILGIRTIWTFVAAVFSFSAQMMSWLIFSITAFMGNVLPDAVGMLLTLLVMIMAQIVVPALITLLVSPLDGIMTSVLYFNRRIKSEGLDLEIRLEKLQ